MNIKCLIRLNEPLYSEKIFRRAGIDVLDLEFPDGSIPPDDVIKKFMTKVEE